ncbi:MAG TPA: alpha/beta fold hydrolase [Terriglobales bacterium]|nr:alpha/beta fold hydrolase [Terriglobales bacterium]
MAGEIRSLMLEGPAGRLEALLNAGEATATHAALVCHPHPMFGGTMHNKVVYNAMKSLSKFGFPVLRFNFRGAGLSEGAHDEGRGEVGDVQAALDHLANEYKLPIIFTGFSFGAAVGLRAACQDERVVGMISLGTPVAVNGRSYTYEFLRECQRPKLFVSGGNDEYSTEQDLRAAYENVAEPKRLVIVPGADHFFLKQLPQMQEAIESWVREHFVGSPA